MIDMLGPSWQWIQEDWRARPLRFLVEIMAWAVSIVCSVWMAATVPTPPLIWIYPCFILGCVMYAWAAWSRQSFGMLANYVLLVTIDSIALTRMWLAA